MAVNWGPVGAQLAQMQQGHGDVTERRLGELAALDLKLQKAMGRRDIGTQLTGAGYSPEEAALGAALIQGEAGTQFAGMERGLSSQQQRGFRQGAVDAYGTGGAEAANQYRAGLGTQMIDATKITQGQAYNPTVAPTSQDIVITDIGQSVIGKNQALGDAATIRANRPPASRASGRSTAAPKLSEIDKLRLKSAMAGIEAEEEVVLDKIANGDESAKVRLAELQAAKEEVFTRFEGGNSMSPDVPEADIGDAVSRDETWYQDPETGRQRKVGVGAAVKHPPVPPGAVEMLWKDPSLKEQFAAKYGAAAADAALAKRPR
jgi:hypothetical protein